MTVAIVLPDRIVSDSRLYGDPHHTVGKIFRAPDGSLFVTAGDSRLTALFEKALKQGSEPEPPDARDDEEFDGAILRPDGRIVVYDKNFSGFLWCSASAVSRSRLASARVAMRARWVASR